MKMHQLIEMHFAHMTIGERIVTLLAEKGKKQVELARYMNIGQSTVNGWTKGGRTPSADAIVPISEFLDVSVWFLLTGEEKNYLTTGEKIKMYRRLRDLTQKELAELSGVSEISIRKYEAGLRHPKKEQLKKIASALKITYAALLSEDYAYCLSELYNHPEKKLSKTAGMEKSMDSEQVELYEAAAPLMAYMRKNWNPHAKVMVDQSSAELLLGHMMTHVDVDSGVLEGEDS